MGGIIPIKDNKMSKYQKQELAKALYDLGKLILSVLVLGQLIGKIFSTLVFVLGLLSFVICFIVATSLNREE